MARVLLILGLIASVVFGWHLYAASDVRRYAEELRIKNGGSKDAPPVEVNPITDIVTMPIIPKISKADGENPFEVFGKALGSIVGGALGKALEPAFERELNLRARELYDLYAMLVPYRVNIPAPEEGEET